MILLAKFAVLASRVEAWLNDEEPEEKKLCDGCGEKKAGVAGFRMFGLDIDDRVYLCPPCSEQSYLGPPASEDPC